MGTISKDADTDSTHDLNDLLDCVLRRWSNATAGNVLFSGDANVCDNWSQVGGPVEGKSREVEEGQEWVARSAGIMALAKAVFAQCWGRERMSQF